MNIDERTNIIWEQVGKIADEDPEFARRLVNINAVPTWLGMKLSTEEPKEAE